MSDAVDIDREGDALAPPAGVAAPRPADCVAAVWDDVMACARCGLEWPVGEAGPGCRPIIYDDLRDRIVSECDRAEIALRDVIGIERLPTDGGARARRRLAELRAIERLIELVIADASIQQRLQEKGKKP